MAGQGRKPQITKDRCEQINRKNRELRVQIKSMLKDQVSGPQRSSEKALSTKRELIKQRNYLMEENNELLFLFKKVFLF
jgi:hypothetical protein